MIRRAIRYEIKAWETKKKNNKGMYKRLGNRAVEEGKGQMAKEESC